MIYLRREGKGLGLGGTRGASALFELFHFLGFCRELLCAPAQSHASFCLLHTLDILYTGKYNSTF